MKTWGRLALAAVVWALPGRAVDWKELKPQGCVSDFATVIGVADRGRLNTYCAAVERATGAQMALVTLPSLQGEPVDDVARAIFRAWSIDASAKGGGVLLLVATGEHRSSLAAGPGLEPLLREGLHDRVLREMRPAVRQGLYGQAMMGAAEEMGSSIARSKGAALTASLPRRLRPALGDWLPWPLVCGAIFFVSGLLLWLMRAGGGLVPGTRPTWGGRGSGGFGGPDSGDGFGGFGGGDSGRGRFTGDW